MKNNQRGQILLIIILLSTVLVTVGLSVSHVTTEETKISKLEEENKKAFAAAEAGIEARLKSTTGDITNLQNLLPTNSGIQSGQALLTTTTGQTFVTPALINKDQQYTFYLVNYDKTNNTFGANYTPSVDIYFNSTNAGCNAKPVLEISLINDANAITRKLADPCGTIGADLAVANANFTPTGTTITFRSHLQASLPTDNRPDINIDNIRLMIVRVLVQSTYLAVQRGSAGDLPPQGQIITADAKTQTNVAKKIQLLQSYPQLPADFFVTSF